MLTTGGGVVSALAGAVSAFVALKAASQSREATSSIEKQLQVAESTRLLNIRPQVAVYVKQSDKQGQRHSSDIQIKNIGTGTAKNVRFKVVRGEEVELKVGGGQKITQWGPIERGIEVLAPGDSLSTFAFNAIGHDFDSDGEIIVFEVTCSDIEGHEYGPENFTVDFNIIKNTAWLGRSSDDPELRLVKAVEDISKSMLKK